MPLADELIKLEQLHDRHGLTDEEFTRAKARLLEAPLSASSPSSKINGYRRSNTDRWFGGVCGGLAISTGVDSWIWRLIFTLLVFAGGTGILLYILLWIFVPTD